jgi:hypothetical protein
MAKTHRCPAMSTRFCIVASPQRYRGLLLRAARDSEPQVCEHTNLHRQSVRHGRDAPALTTADNRERDVRRGVLVHRSGSRAPMTASGVEPQLLAIGITVGQPCIHAGTGILEPTGDSLGMRGEQNLD